MKQIIKDEKYWALIEEIKATITEAVHNSRWFLVKGYWRVGKLIRTEFTGHQLEKRLQDLAGDIGIGERTLWYCLAVYDKYPDLQKIPEGKNISWNKLITKYLPAAPKEKSKEVRAKEIKLDRVENIENRTAVFFENGTLIWYPEFADLTRILEEINKLTKPKI